MLESMSSEDRRRAMAVGVGLGLAAAAALSLAVCPGQKPSLTPELSPESPSDPADDPEKTGKERSVRAEVRQNVQGVSDDDDYDSTGELLPSVSIDPQVFDNGTWGLSEVSKCVQAPEDVMVTWPGPNDMRVISLSGDAQPHVPVSVAEALGGKESQRRIALKVGRMIVLYELPTDGSQEEVEGILTRLCRDVRLAVHRTDWPSKLLCQGPDDEDCDAYVGQLQAEGSVGHRPVEMMNDLLDLLTDGDFFDKIDRYKSHAFSVDPHFSRGLGHFSVMVEHSVIDGEPTLVYSVTSSNVGGFSEFTTPEEVVEFIYRHIDRP